MVEGQIILQSAGASFGRLEQPAADGTVLYSTTFTDPGSGLSVSIVWTAESVREFMERAIESMAGIVPVPRPRLHVARSLPPGRGGAGSWPAGEATGPA